MSIWSTEPQQILICIRINSAPDQIYFPFFSIRYKMPTYAFRENSIMAC